MQSVPQEIRATTSTSRPRAQVQVNVMQWRAKRRAMNDTLLALLVFPNQIPKQGLEHLLLFTCPARPEGGHRDIVLHPSAEDEPSPWRVARLRCHGSEIAVELPHHMTCPCLHQSNWLGNPRGGPNLFVEFSFRQPDHARRGQSTRHKHAFRNIRCERVECVCRLFARGQGNSGQSSPTHRACRLWGSTSAAHLPTQVTLSRIRRRPSSNNVACATASADNLWKSRPPLSTSLGRRPKA